MKTTSSEKISNLQNVLPNIRNICILAHVDHGKTSLADTLVASNGIISQRMAGKLRYLDSREDEQLRGITMKSSAISLQYSEDNADYLINLIDSPGHIDFSSEVSTAVRLCDGAVVLVDVVEGVCPQTHAVLRQSWLENIKPVLVLNKLDRLITELKMTPLEAHIHLIQILEQINAVTGELYTSDIMEKAGLLSMSGPNKKEDTTVGSDKVFDWSTGLEDRDDAHLYFSPDQSNVVFASALDGWGFTIEHFANMYATKLGVNAEVLKKTLWGDFYLETKTKLVRKGAMAKAKKPLFVQIILENIWSVYDAVCVQRDKERIAKIVKTLDVKMQARDLRSTDPKVQLQTICSQWLPLSTSVLSVVVHKLPSPLQMGDERVERLLCSVTRQFNSLHPKSQLLKEEFLKSNSSDKAPVIIYISKMVSVERNALPQNKLRPLTAADLAKRREAAREHHAKRLAEAQANLENLQTTDMVQTHQESITESSCEEKTESSCEEVLSSHVFIAFARVFSGTVKKGMKLYVLSPKHDPEKALQETEGLEIGSDGLVNIDSLQHVTVAEIKDLYIFMGRELEAVDQVPAGNVFGIGGLEKVIIKSATMSDTLACPSFTDMYLGAAPIVRVAVEPKQPSDMNALCQGMKLLNQADACVQVYLQKSGEHILATAGEVHLEKCIKDLKAIYAKVDVKVSDPVVPFRETVIHPPKVDRVNENIDDQMNLNAPKVDNQVDSSEENETALDGQNISLKTPDQCCSIEIIAKPLPLNVVKLLEDNEHLLDALSCHAKASLPEKSSGNKLFKLTAETLKSLCDLKYKLEEAFKEDCIEWGDVVDHIWAFGPKHKGPNILVNKVEGYDRSSVWQCISETSNGKRLRDHDNSVVNGFQLATLSGPLCEEPMMGVCYELKHWQLSAKQDDKLDNICEGLAASTVGDNVPLPNASKSVTYGPFSGQLMSTMKEGCRRAFQAQPQRLMAAMYSCEIQATAEVLGRMYAVIGKRNGRVLSEEMKEGTSTFIIEAVLPVIESFGLADEIRKRTSGLASPQLTFSHWEVIDIDPFWVPTTEEEYLHFGEKADSENQARQYMNAVRRRKGLKTQEKLVEHAEKQRNLSKNK